jgi:hypothetical protein
MLLGAFLLMGIAAFYFTQVKGKKTGIMANNSEYNYHLLGNN